MWHKYEDKQPTEGQRIHAIGFFEGEIVGQTETLVEGVSRHSDGGIDLEGDHYYSLIYKILYWKDASDLPEDITSTEDYGLEFKTKKESE